MTTKTNGLADSDIIESLRKKLMIAVEEGNDELQRKYSDELAAARADAVRKKEIKDLKADIDNRDLLRQRAETITKKCKTQREAIDELLKVRDEIMPLLKQVIDLSRLLPAMEVKAWEQFANAEQLAGNARARLPQGYLPANLKASTLEVRGGITIGRKYHHRSAFLFTKCRRHSL